MWLRLSEGVFFFGPGGVNVIKDIDMRDKPSTYIFRTELLSGSTRISLVKESSDDILKLLGETKND
jgi:hypothetical protein